MRSLVTPTERRVLALVAIYSGGLRGGSERDHDNQWEAGDGDQVFALLAELIRQSPSLAQAVATGPACRYAPQGLRAIARDALSRRDHQPPPAGGLFDETARAQRELFK